MGHDPIAIQWELAKTGVVSTGNHVPLEFNLGLLRVSQKSEDFLDNRN
jgi:hypothetical protein